MKTERVQDFSAQVEELRKQFDASFAAPPPPPAEDQADLLLIRVGGARLALRIRELRGLYSSRKVAPLPGAKRELLGMAGIRGRVVAVYDLAALLGMSEAGVGRWLALCGAQEDLGFSIPEVESHVKVMERAIVQATAADRAQTHVPEVVRVGEAVYGVVNISSVLETVRGLARNARGHEEEAV